MLNDAVVNDWLVRSPFVKLVDGGWFLSNTRFAVLINNGDGAFAAPSYYSGGADGSLAMGDFFGDERTHLALLDGTNIIVYLSNGDGTFTAEPFVLGYPSHE